MDASAIDLCIKGLIETIEFFDAPAIILNDRFDEIAQNSKMTPILKLHLTEINQMSMLTNARSTSANFALFDFCVWRSDGDRTEFDRPIYSITFMRSTACGVEYWIVKFNLIRKSERLETIEKQIHNARMIAMAETSSGIAHEINNPLTVVLSKASLIEKILISDPHARQTHLLDSIKKIAVHSTRISKIIRSLRSLSRNDDLQPLREFNLVEVLEESLSLSSERFKSRGIQLKIELNGLTEIAIKGRDFQISQVLINLLNNAFDATNEQPLGLIYVSLQIQDNRAVLRVSDSGPGISKQIEDKIMLPFFTTKKEGQGTGIGLSISSSIITAHGGKLKLNRTVSDSCFEFSLPIFEKAGGHGIRTS